MGSEVTLAKFCAQAIIIMSSSLVVQEVPAWKHEA